MHSRDKQKLGKIGEDIAAVYLTRQGYEITERNYRCVGGEIDIVCWAPDGVLVFVEVKTRLNDRYGTGLEAVARTKQTRIVLASLNYISEKGIAAVDICYDVISVTLDVENSIEHITNAFDAL